MVKVVSTQVMREAFRGGLGPDCFGWIPLDAEGIERERLRKQRLKDQAKRIRRKLKQRKGGK